MYHINNKMAAHIRTLANESNRSLNGLGLSFFHARVFSILSCLSLLLSAALALFRSAISRKRFIILFLYTITLLHITLELLEYHQSIEVCLHLGDSMETSKHFHAQNDEGRGGDRSHEHTQL